MATLEQPPRYNDSFSEFEVPSYSSSLQQLQNLPPPLNDEPSLMDAPGQTMASYSYEPQKTNSVIVLDNQDMTPPPYEHHSIAEESTDSMQNQVPVNNSMIDHSNSSFNGYPTVEVDDKIKDILSRYNPHAGMNSSKMEDSYPVPPQSQPIRQPQPQQLQPPRQAQQAPAAPQMQKPPVYQSPPPQNKQYPTQQYQQSEVQVVNPQLQQQQQQLRARVVQNVPSQQVQSSPPPQRFQSQVHQQPSPQVHQQPPQVHSPPPQVHAPQQSYQQTPQQHSNQVYSHPSTPIQYQQPQTTAQGQPAPHEASYLQLVQQQAIQFQLQNQQIQQLQQQSGQQAKETLNQMQGYFDRISSFMERVDKRLTALEGTAQAILKNQSGDVSGVKGELEGVKKMHHHVESDFDIARKLQQELDSKYEKEKRKEERRKAKAASSSSSSKSESKHRSSSSSTSSSVQECPICTLKVPFAELELHVNQCLEGIEKSETKPDIATQEKASFWKRVFGPGPKKDETSNNNQIVPASKTLPTRPALPAPVSTTSMPGQTPMYPSGQDFYQMPQGPFVYRPGGYPQPQMVPPQIYGYPQPQQIYYYPPNMAQPQTQQKK